jgi:hypothetical protein
MMDLLLIVLPVEVFCRSDDFQIMFDSPEPCGSTVGRSIDTGLISIKSISTIYYIRTIQKRMLVINNI